MNTTRIIKGFDENGTNANLLKGKEENANRLLALKKEGIVKPVKDFVSPKKEGEKLGNLSAVYALFVKLLQIEKNPEEAAKILPSLERFKTLSYGVPKDAEQAKLLLGRLRSEFDEAYFLKKLDFDNRMRDYENYASPKYRKASTSFKLMRLIERLLALITKNKESPKDTVQKSIDECFKQLEGGIMKPPKEKGGEKQFVVKFSEFYQIPKDEVDLNQLLNTIRLDNRETNEIFENKEKIKHDALKFSPPIHAVVSYTVQEAVHEFLELGMKNAKSLGKNSVSMENLNSAVLGESTFYPLFFNLPAMKALDEFIERKREYDAEIKNMKAVKTKRSKYTVTRSFYDVEKTDGHMKVNQGGKKVWKGLSSESLEHASTVIKVFEKLKVDKKSKMKLSGKAKEVLNLLVAQFLETLSARFDIHRKHKCKIAPVIGKTSKIRPEEKSIKFETVVEIFDIVLCPKNEKSTKFIETITKFKGLLAN